MTTIKTVSFVQIKDEHNLEDALEYAFFIVKNLKYNDHHPDRLSFDAHGFQITFDNEVPFS